MDQKKVDISWADEIAQHILSRISRVVIYMLQLWTPSLVLLLSFGLKYKPDATNSPWTLDRPHRLPRDVTLAALRALGVRWDSRPRIHHWSYRGAHTRSYSEKPTGCKRQETWTDPPNKDSSDQHRKRIWWDSAGIFKTDAVLPKHVMCVCVFFSGSWCVLTLHSSAP